MIRSIFKAGSAYFALVFGAGFVLGVIRVLFVVPSLGERYAELLEIPLMLFVIYFTAGFVVSRFTNSAWQNLNCLYIGFVGLFLLLFAELSMVLVLRGIGLYEYFKSRDIMSGSVYILSLIIYTAMPWLIGRYYS